MKYITNHIAVEGEDVTLASAEANDIHGDVELHAAPFSTEDGFALWVEGNGNPVYLAAFTKYGFTYVNDEYIDSYNEYPDENDETWFHCLGWFGYRGEWDEQEAFAFLMTLPNFPIKQ